MLSVGRPRTQCHSTFNKWYGMAAVDMSDIYGSKDVQQFI